MVCEKRFQDLLGAFLKTLKCRLCCKTPYVGLQLGIIPHVEMALFANLRSEVDPSGFALNISGSALAQDLVGIAQSKSGLATADRYALDITRLQG
jgi:hypothetical protein